MTNENYQRIMTASCLAEMAIHDEYMERSVMANSIVSATQTQIPTAKQSFADRCRKFYDEHFQELQRKFGGWAVAIGQGGVLGHGKTCTGLLRRFDSAGMPQVNVYYIPKKGEPRVLKGLIIPHAIIG
jgi:hypothetical protein